MTIDITDDVQGYCRVKLDEAKEYLAAIERVRTVYIPYHESEKPANKTWKQMYDELVQTLDSAMMDLSRKYGELQLVHQRIGRKIMDALFDKEAK